MPTGLLPDDPGNWRGLREIFIEERQDLHPTRKRRPVWRGARSAPGGSWMFQPLTDEPLSGRPIQSIRFKTGRQDGVRLFCVLCEAVTCRTPETYLLPVAATAWTCPGIQWVGHVGAWHGCLFRCYIECWYPSTTIW